MSTDIRRIFIFGYFRPGHMWPKICFAKFSVTVYTGSSSRGRKCVAAEMCFNPGRPEFEWAENLSTYSKAMLGALLGALSWKHT